MSDKTQRQREAQKRYREKNAEKLKAKRKEYYEANRERELENGARYRNENPEKIKNIRDSYLTKNREELREKFNLWREQNTELANQLTRQWRKNNPAAVAAGTAKRRSERIKRTPKWLSKEQLGAIKDWYYAAEMLSKIFPWSMHVDHIVPLQGGNVSGLHVPWNLQLLPAKANLSKGNKVEVLNETY
jgi:5-methylcytosine-specific restriction endonuclease McrA